MHTGGSGPLSHHPSNIAESFERSSISHPGPGFWMRWRLRRTGDMGGTWLEPTTNPYKESARWARATPVADIARECIEHDRECILGAESVVRRPSHRRKAICRQPSAYRAVLAKITEVRMGVSGRNRVRASWGKRFCL